MNIKIGVDILFVYADRATLISVHQPTGDMARLYLFSQIIIIEYMV